MKVYCLFSLESPQRGDSNEYTQYIISKYIKENHPKLSQICNYGICSKGPKNEFEPAVVNEPSVFEPSKFYCIANKYCKCKKASVSYKPVYCFCRCPEVSKILPGSPVRVKVKIYNLSSSSLRPFQCRETDFHWLISVITWAI